MSSHEPLLSSLAMRLRSHRGAALMIAVLAAAALAALVIAGLPIDRSQPAPVPSATPPIPTDLAPDAVTERAFPSLTYGVHAFLWWNETMRTLDLENIKLAQFTHIKQRFSWVDIEPEPGVWHWEQADGVVNEVERRDLSLIARLDGPPDWAQVAVAPDNPSLPPIRLDAWGEYCGALAERYRGRIVAYQVWNEPNLSREWLNHPPNAGGYVKLLRACAEAIRANDPEAIIISAGLAPTGDWLPTAIPDTDYLRMMYAAGAADWFDVLGLNAPGYKYPPETSPEQSAEMHGGHRWFVFRHVEDMRAIMVEQGDAHKQIAILEMGWTLDPRPDSPYHWHAVTPEQQAAYLVDAYRYAAEHWRPWVGLMTTIFIADISWTEDNEEYWWAINEAGYGADWRGRPAYYALANMPRWIDDTFIPARDPGSPEATTIQPIEPDQDTP